MEKEPFVVKIHDVHIEEEYVEWVNVLKTTYRKSQIRAAVKVNSEKLLWNWQLGRDLVQRKAEERWGTGIVEQLSLDLQAEFPDEKGFSTSNIWYMKRWYLFYAKLLQKSEMRKNMVMDLIYRGFIYAANYSESHYNPRRSQIKTELRYLFVTTPNR